ncbi:MAG: transglycosylase SLT domain-containing protein [Bacteroidota bacterium]
MRTYRPNLNRSHRQAYQQSYYQAPPIQQTSLARPLNLNMRGNLKNIAILAIAVFVTNLLTHTLFNPSIGFSAEKLGASSMAALGSYSSSSGSMAIPAAAGGSSLYLMNEASVYVHNPVQFEGKVREVAKRLGIPPEWLMAVMYSESKFDAAVRNFKGSGATGLIQFMPATASEMGASLSQIGSTDHVQQMEYVYQYLQTVRERYGNYKSLTDLYLGILYPKAINQDPCYTLYARPSKSYKQNSGLDENKDGRVSVSDIDKRMQRKFPQAYIVKQ